MHLLILFIIVKRENLHLSDQPSHEVAHAAAHQLADEQQLHLVLVLLPSIQYWPGRRRHPRLLEEGLEAVDVDRRAAVQLAKKDESIDVAARAGCHCGGSVPRRAQLAYVCCVKQLFGAQQHLVAHFRRL